MVLLITNNYFAISDSLVLVATGWNHNINKYKDYCQVVDLNSRKSCVNLPHYPFPMHYGGGGLLNNTPVICGGYSYSTYAYESACYYHNKITNVWTLFGNLNKARSEFGVAPLSEGFWVTGGHAPSLTDSTEIIHLNGTITFGTPLPAAQAGHCMVTLSQDKVLLIGGYPPVNFKKTLFYNKNLKTFTNGPTLNSKRHKE